jgi:tryptophanyl-tRNA synthetase
VAPDEVERDFAGHGYGAFKEAVGEALVEMLAPVRERYRQLRSDEEGLERTLAEGAERARGIARETMAEVRPLMGIGPAAVGRPV